jgi:hypothetical protein
MAGPLYLQIAVDWAITMKSDHDKLDVAITAHDMPKIRQLFQRYRRQAGDRFYRVDSDLKRLCDELREVGEPLASVLRMIE